ncbi:MAG: serine hydroxymethyltransferase [Candidatus Buchananbacteria bacterium]|nr:serine hydroxymethyltransferase [Candidatus Buchananbacteria bacterium]
MKYEHLAQQDPEIFDLINQETKRQQDGLAMIPSENHASIAVLEAMASTLSNKYAEGYPHKRYYTGNQYIDQVEDLAISRAKKLFNAEHANVQPNAGSPANLAIYLATLKPGDTVMGMKLDQGGHLTHGHPVNLSGQLYHFVQYGVSQKTEMIDYDQVRAMAKKEKPKLIVTGATAYPRIFDFKIWKDIADEVGALLLADISHFVGLCISGDHPQPFPHADFVMTTTHKTLRGPRSAVILSKEKFAKDIDKAIFPGMQGGPLEHVIAAKAVCFNEALKPEFKQYGNQIVKNAKALANALLNEGIRLVSGGTDIHLMLIDCNPLKITGRTASEVLADGGIYTNRNTIPYDPGSAFEPTGIRLGTPALTTRGMKESEMKIIGTIIAKQLKNIKDTNIHAELKATVAELVKQFPIYEGM